MRYLLALALALICCLPVQAEQPSWSNFEALKGRPKMRVIVEQLPKDVSQLGFSTESLSDLVELKLRQSGVVVDPNGLIAIYLNVDGITVADTMLAYNIHLEVMEPAIIVRTHNLHPGAVVWETGYMGVLGLGRAEQSLKNVVADVIDKFSLDYLRANPVVQPTQTKP